MTRYMALIEQDGEGCDYSIACGRDWIILKSHNTEDAKSELSQKIAEEYQDERRLKSAIILEVANTLVVQLSDVYAAIGLAKRAEKELFLCLQRKRQYEQLRKEFEGT